MSRLIYSGLTVPTATQVIQQPGQYIQGGQLISGQGVVGPQIIQQRQSVIGQEVIGQQVVGQSVVGQQVLGPQVDIIRQQAVAQPAQVTEVVTSQAPVVQQVQQVQQVVEGPPQSMGPVQTTVQQQQTQLGESRFEYIPKEKTWVEYEQVQSTEYVPKEVKLTDHYAVEHITEYHPKVYQDTYVDYYPQERLQERVEYQQQVKKINHPPVSSEITETILASIPGPQTLIQSQSQVVETGKTENVTNIQQTTVGTTSVPLVGSRVISSPVQQVVNTVQQPVVYGSTVGVQGGQVLQSVAGGQQVVYGNQVVAPQVISQPLVASRVVQPQVYGTTIGYPQQVLGSTTTQVVNAPQAISSRVVLR